MRQFQSTFYYKSTTVPKYTMVNWLIGLIKSIKVIKFNTQLTLYCFHVLPLSFRRHSDVSRFTTCRSFSWIHHFVTFRLWFNFEDFKTFLHLVKDLMKHYFGVLYLDTPVSFYTLFQTYCNLPKVLCTVSASWSSLLKCGNLKRHFDQKPPEVLPVQPAV